MKRLFKYIVRKVDEKVANNLKEIKEIKEISNDIESKKIISNVLIGVGVVGLLMKVDMIIK